MALGLACIGVYGLMAYSVARRRHEFCLRVTLGARGRDIVRLVVGEGPALCTAGLAIGLATASGVARLMSGELFAVTPLDPRTYAMVAVLLSCVALVACWIPARRAAGVSPTAGLKDQ